MGLDKFISKGILREIYGSLILRKKGGEINEEM
jgi:hypothetical protein